MGRVMVSGAPDSSRRQPERTHEVFRELEVASQQHTFKHSQNRYILIFHYTCRSLAQWLLDR